jgi:soluble lytic murein transglycosylase
MLFFPRATLSQETFELQPDAALWQEAVALRTQLSRQAADRQLVFKAAALELAIGMPRRALAVLEQHAGPDALWDANGFRLRGEVEYALGRYEAAARSFVRALGFSAEADRGILAAQAAVSFQKAELHDDARAQYSVAANELPQLAGWLAVREASVSTDTAYAFRRLSEAAPEAMALAYRTRGFLYARDGETTRAITAFERGGHYLSAAELALTAGDSANSKRLAYVALETDDTALVRQSVNLIEESLPPGTPTEFLALAAASRRVGALRVAAEFAAAAVSAGDSSAQTLIYWGDLLSASGSRLQALAAYRRAAAMDGEVARDAAFWHGRTLLLVGRSNEGMAELASFVERYPDHQAVPRALYGMADRRRRERRLAESDSLNLIVVEKWPGHRYSSSARMDLATGALERGDTASAIEWYRQEIAFVGTQRNVAQYRLGGIRAASGDTVAARAIWAALARVDSLGYYGTVARTAALLPPLAAEPSTVPIRSNETEQILSTLDLLREAYMQEELEVYLDSLKARESWSPADLLDLGEGLIEHGFVQQGIHVGWLASRSYTLNHPRVLRIVFPWPFRELIEQKADDLELDPHLLAGLIRQESAFTPGAVSRAGAYGLMQLMPPTARDVARRIGAEWDSALLTVADANLHFGAIHLAGLLRQYDNRIEPTLAAYNAGGTRVRRWLRAFGMDDPVRFVERIPYTETRGYLQTVLRNWALYRALYPAQEFRGDR